MGEKMKCKEKERKGSSERGRKRMRCRNQIDGKRGRASWRMSLPCRSCCRGEWACLETWGGVETPAQTASSWDGRWLLNLCWLSEIPDVKAWFKSNYACFYGKTLKAMSAFLNASNDIKDLVTVIVDLNMICTSLYPCYLLSLHLTAEVWDLNFHGVQLFIRDLGDSKWLSLFRALEGQLG